MGPYRPTRVTPGNGARTSRGGDASIVTGHRDPPTRIRSSGGRPSYFGIGPLAVDTPAIYDTIVQW